MPEKIDGYKIVYSTEAYPQIPSQVELRIFKSTSLVPSTTDPTQTVEREDLTLELDYGVSIQTLKIPLRKIDPPVGENENIAEDPDGPYPLQLLSQIISANLVDIESREESISDELGDEIDEFLETYVVDPTESQVEAVLKSVGSSYSSSGWYYSNEATVNAAVDNIIEFFDTLKPTGGVTPHTHITSLLTKYQVISARPPEAALQPIYGPGGSLSQATPKTVTWGDDPDDPSENPAQVSTNTDFNPISINIYYQPYEESSFKRLIQFSLPGTDNAGTIWDVTIESRIPDSTAPSIIIDPYIYLYGPTTTTNLYADPIKYLLTQDDDGGRGVDSKLQIRLAKPTNEDLRFFAMFTAVGQEYKNEDTYADIYFRAVPVE